VGAAWVEDYYQNGKRWWLRLHEKGGKFHELPAHHNAEAYLDAYLEAARIAGDRKGPLFRSANRSSGKLTEKPLRRNNALDTIKRRAIAAGLSPRVCCHTFRATGITAYLESGGTIEKAQQIPAHESPKTTKLYDRTSDQVTPDEIERIAIGAIDLICGPRRCYPTMLSQAFPRSFRCPRRRTIPTNGDYVTIKEAAKFLGVSPDTLRNWDYAGKLKPIRHPMNGYRLYRLKDLESLPRRAP
jgi:hypothetical protein